MSQNRFSFIIVVIEIYSHSTRNSSTRQGITWGRRSSWLLSGKHRSALAGLSDLTVGIAFQNIYLERLYRSECFWLKWSARDYYDTKNSPSHIFVKRLPPSVPSLTPIVSRGQNHHWVAAVSPEVWTGAATWHSSSSLLSSNNIKVGGVRMFSKVSQIGCGRWEILYLLGGGRYYIYMGGGRSQDLPQTRLLVLIELPAL